MTDDDREAEPVRTTHRVEISPRTIGLVVLVIAGVWIAWQLTSVLIVITVAMVMVGTLDPVVAWFERRGIRRGRALALIFLVILLAVGAVLLLTVPTLVEQLLHIIDDAPAKQKQLLLWLNTHKWAKPVAQAIQAVPVNNLMTRAGDRLIGYSSEILSTVGYAITTMFLSIYLLADPIRAKGLLYAVVPRHHHIKLARILIELTVIVGGYMRGQLITSVAIAIFTFTLLTILGVDDALALALFAGLTDIIPFIGGYVASAPAIASVSKQGTPIILLVFGLMFAYQEFESRILVPRVYGRVLRLSPAIVLVALLIGGTLMGILGALLALPIAAGLRMIVRELRVELPGNAPSDGLKEAQDEKAETIYVQLTEGANAQDAAVIAGELAVKIKETEQAGSTLTAEMPAIMAELGDDTPVKPENRKGLTQPEEP